MWTEITRPKYERAGGRYASDLKSAVFLGRYGGTNGNFVLVGR
jgi:hypothetical protein